MFRFEEGKTYVHDGVELTCMKRTENAVWFAEQPNAPWIVKHLIDDLDASEEEDEFIYEEEEAEYTYFGDYTLVANEYKGENNEQ